MVYYYDVWPVLAQPAGLAINGGTTIAAICYSGSARGNTTGIAICGSTRSFTTAACTCAG